MEINSSGETFIIILKIYSLHLQVHEKKLTCYIIDDELLAQEILEDYVAKVSFLKLKRPLYESPENGLWLMA